MYARVQKTWARNFSLHGSNIDFGVFTYMTRYSRDMLGGIEQHLTSHSDFVEKFLPFVCQQEFPATCLAASLPYASVGFFNNAGNAFAGEQSVTNFHAIANSIRAGQEAKWYHPTKFSASWRSMPTTVSDGNHTSLWSPGGFYNGKCGTMACLLPPCNETVVDQCVFVKT